MLKPTASATASSPFPRPRTLIHPGPFNPVRIQSKHSERGRHIRLARPFQNLSQRRIGIMGIALTPPLHHPL